MNNGDNNGNSAAADVAAKQKAKAQRLEAGLAAAADPDALLRLDTVLALTGLSKATLYRRMKDPVNPAPMPQRIGPACTRWPARAVREWMQRTATPTATQREGSPS